jgi:VWFA-related protein
MRRTAWAALILVAVLCLRASAQEPARQVFRGSVDLVTIMVYVVDSEGRPVPGLTPEDFVVELDGQRRPVRALDYRETVSAPPAGSPTDVTETTNVRTGAGGRVFMLLVDDLSFQASSIDLPAIRTSLARMIGQLAPQDRVGLATTSGRGPIIRPTSDHQRVATAVRSVGGRASNYKVLGVYVSLVEAIEILRGGFNVSALREVADRECRLQNIDVFEVCESIIEGQARVVLDETRDHTAMQLRSYEAVLASLADEPRPRILVLVSDGIATGGIVGFTSDLTRVSQAAAEANTQLYVVVGDRDNSVTGEGDRGRVTARSDEVALLHDGIESIASSVGGALLRLVGSADRPFDRMLLESSGVYEVGVDAPPGGRARLPEVVVSVNRPDVTVRANRRALVPAVAATMPVAADEVRRVLVDGATAVGVPLSVAASSRRAPGSKDLQLAVDLAVPDSVLAPLEVAFAVVNEQGRTVKSGGGTMNDAPRDGEYRFTFALPLQPGRYDVRVAVSDPDGRVGGVEHPVTLELRQMGRFLASDLQTGWIDQQGTRRFLGLTRLPAAAVAADVGIELYPADETPPAGAVAIRIDVTEVGRTAPLAIAMFEPTVAGDRWQLHTSIPVDTLLPGLFTVTATILDGGAAVGTLTTTLEKVAAPVEAGPTRPVLPSREAVIDALSGELRGVRRAFNPAPLLTPAMTRAAFGSLAESIGQALPEVLAQSTGSDEAWWDAVGVAAREPRTGFGAFARGLQNLRLPNGPAALTQFELALERAPASIAAMLYLGAAHAANRGDVSAAGAWQLALADPAVGFDWHLAQADALVRIGDWPAARATLRDMQARFPESRDVLVRLVEVELADGQVDEARPLLARLLDERPDDMDARWWQLVLAFADAVQPEQSPAVQTFLDLANRYLAEDGPRAEIVRAWVAALS